MICSYTLIIWLKTVIMTALDSTHSSFQAVPFTIMKPMCVCASIYFSSIQILVLENPSSSLQYYYTVTSFLRKWTSVESFKTSCWLIRIWFCGSPMPQWRCRKKKKGSLTHSLFQELVIPQTLGLVSGLCVHDVVC